jgi:hypothetical protein
MSEGGVPYRTRPQISSTVGAFATYPQLTTAPYAQSALRCNLQTDKWVCDDTGSWVASASKVPLAISLRPK